MTAPLTGRQAAALEALTSSAVSLSAAGVARRIGGTSHNAARTLEALRVRGLASCAVVDGRYLWWATSPAGEYDLVTVRRSPARDLVLVLAARDAGMGEVVRHLMATDTDLGLTRDEARRLLVALDALTESGLLSLEVVTSTAGPLARGLAARVLGRRVVTA